MKFARRNPLDPARFQYLEGCVREEESYALPLFAAEADKPLLYISFGSLGAGDTELLKRIIAVLATPPRPHPGSFSARPITKQYKT